MDVREKLVELLANYFDIGDSYAYNLTRVKSAFACGTMGFDDFEEFDEETVEDIATHLITHGVTVQEWKPVSEPPKETGHYLVNIHQEDDEKGESADFVLDAWYQVNGLLFVPDTIGWTLLNEWHGLTEQMIPFITHWTKRPEPPKGE